MVFVDIFILVNLLPVELVVDLFVSTGRGARATNIFAEVVVSISSVKLDFILSRFILFSEFDLTSVVDDLNDPSLGQKGSDRKYKVLYLFVLGGSNG